MIPVHGTPASPHLDFAGEVRAATKFPVFHTARITDVATARHAVAEGKLDMVGMTRAHIAEPHIGLKVAEGREHEIRPCVGGLSHVAYAECFQRERRSVDQVVVEHGTLPLDEVYFVLKKQSVNRGEVDYPALIAGRAQTVVHNPAGTFRLYRVGDAVSSRNIHAGIYDALRLCKNS